MPGEVTVNTMYNDNFIDVDLNTGTVARSFNNHVICGGDVKHNRFGAYLWSGGVPWEVDDVEVKGYFIRPDGTTVVLTGSVENNLVYVRLTANCYTYPGNFVLSIKISTSSVVGTVRVVDGTIIQTETEPEIAGGGDVPADYNTHFQVVEYADGAEESIGWWGNGSVIVLAEHGKSVYTLFKNGNNSLFGVTDAENGLDCHIRQSDGTAQGERDGEIFIEATDATYPIRVCVIPHY